MIKRFSVLFLSMAVTVATHAQNEVNGAWFALDEFGNFTTNTTTANHLVANGGIANAYITRATDTFKFDINGSLTGQAYDDNSREPIIYVGSSVAQDVIITATPGVNVTSKAGDHTLDIDNNGDLTISNGSYNGNGSSKNGLNLLNSGTVTLNNVFATGSHSGNDKGGIGLNVDGPTAVFINSSTNHILQGGHGGNFTVSRTSGISTDTIHGRQGALIKANLTANGIAAIGGDGGNNTFNKARVSSESFGNTGLEVDGARVVRLNKVDVAGGEGGNVTLFARGGGTYNTYGGNALQTGNLSAGSSISNVYSAVGGTGGTVADNSGNNTGGTANLNGGTAILLGTTAAGTALTGDRIIGGLGGELTSSDDDGNFNVIANGGTALVTGSSATPLQVDVKLIVGGNGGEGTSDFGTMNINGADAINGSVEVFGDYFSTNSGGKGGTAYTGSAIANANGGDALDSNGATIIHGGTYYGGYGGSARSATTASSEGGHGIKASSGTLVIHDGFFVAGNGGTATTTNGAGSTANANGGHGLYASGADVTIHGGAFLAGAGGTATAETDHSARGTSIYAFNSDLTIDHTEGVALVIPENIIITNTSTKGLTINKGKITTDIIKDGSGTLNVDVDNQAKHKGRFIQNDGIIDVTLENPNDAEFFKKVYVNNDGVFKFSSEAQVDGRFKLDGAAKLEFAENGRLVDGADLQIGYGDLQADSNLELLSDSRISFTSNLLTGAGGSLTVDGDLIFASNSNSRVDVKMYAATPSGSVEVLKAANVATNNRTLASTIRVDHGWIAEQTDLSFTGGAVVSTYDYRSVAETSLGSLPGNITDVIDGVITNMTASDFHRLSSAGQSAGTEIFHYAYSQMPDTSETTIRVSKEVNAQIAARGTEYRSMNGFASTKAAFDQPRGAAGPAAEKEQPLQGWIRAYGSRGDRSSNGNFSGYESDSYGAVIGIDKSFGNILVGLAGGYAKTDLDGGNAYTADVDTYHGTLYSTIGGESIFVDLALTYGEAETGEKSDWLEKSKFQSEFYGFYLGAGKSIRLGKKMLLTPEASLLATYYEQDSNTRKGKATGGNATTLDSYDTMSYLGTLGINFSTYHQIDWLQLGFAFLPEVRVQWLHEFEDDPDSLSFRNFDGQSYSMAVRPREEDAFRFGLGLDMWNWRLQRGKMELDYDYLMSEDYTEHLFSGKVTWKF